MKMKRNETEIVDAYTKLKQKYGGNIQKEQMSDFIKEYFDDDKLIEWIPPDFTNNPSVAKKVKDTNYR